ncbi:MAG: LysM peptidoglycan-binding domain-containing protein [Planctomycetota bacterium]|jgi:nucleoid-associated protein YgaU
MKQLMPCLVALALGIAVGVGIGTMISKSKVAESQMKIDELQSQMEISQADAQKAIKKAMDEAAQHKKKLSRNQALISRLTAELAKMKAQKQQAIATPPADTADEETVSRPPATVTPSVPSTEYIVKDGDSLWKIAEEQLGNGMRYKEILRLNPNISEDQALHEGTKLKIPTQEN